VTDDDAWRRRAAKLLARRTSGKYKKLIAALDRAQDKIRDSTTFLILGSREDRILHGVYFLFENNEPFTISGPQLRPLKKYGFNFGAWKFGWPYRMTYGGKYSLENRTFPLLEQYEERPLKHLQIDGLITYEKIDIVTPPGHALKISVTIDGARRARRLHSFWSRMNLYYEESKGGMLFAILAIAFSILMFIAGHFWK
jgi:hypothetical protein